MLHHFLYSIRQQLMDSTPVVLIEGFLDYWMRPSEFGVVMPLQEGRI